MNGSLLQTKKCLDHFDCFLRHYNITQVLAGTNVTADEIVLNINAEKDTAYQNLKFYIGKTILNMQTSLFIPNMC